MLTMKMDQVAIEEALTDWLQAQMPGTDLNTREITIKLTAGRGKNGHKAEISVAPPAATPTVTVAEPDVDSEEEAVPFDFDQDSTPGE